MAPLVGGVAALRASLGAFLREQGSRYEAGKRVRVTSRRLGALR
jgi:hypothetical protein